MSNIKEEALFAELPERCTAFLFTIIAKRREIEFCIKIC